MCRYGLRSPGVLRRLAGPWGRFHRPRGKSHQGLSDLASLRLLQGNGSAMEMYITWPTMPHYGLGSSLLGTRGFMVSPLLGWVMFVPVPA